MVILENQTIPSLTDLEINKKLRLLIFLKVDILYATNFKSFNQVCAPCPVLKYMYVPSVDVQW